MSRFWNKLTGADELRFGLTRKLVALIVVALGFLTFFLPLVSVDPQVMGKTDWSAFDMVGYIDQAELVRSSSDLQLFPVEVAVAYLLLPLAFYVVAVSRSQRRLVHIAIVGLGLVLYGWSRAGETFGTLFYRNYPPTEMPAGKHLSYVELMIALLAVMVALLFLTVIQLLEAETPQKLPILAVKPRKVQEPEFVQAEVVADDRESTRPDRSLGSKS